MIAKPTCAKKIRALIAAKVLRMIEVTLLGTGSPIPDPNRAEDFTKFQSPDLISQRIQGWKVTVEIIMNEGLRAIDAQGVVQ